MNIQQKSKQDFFNNTLEHMQKQGKRAMQFEEDGVSVYKYRTADGLTCAVGCHLPEGEWFDCKGPVYILYKQYPEVEKYIGSREVYQDFWEEMQDLHDSEEYKSLSDLNCWVAEIARAHSLTVPFQITNWEGLK